MKTLRLLFIRSALMLAFTLTAGAASKQLNLFIWSEYIDPAIIRSFEQKFECKVNVDLYEDNEAMLAKVQGGGAGLYDVVVPSDNILPAMLKQNLLAPLRHKNIPNLKNLDEKFADPAYDRGNKFSVAYQWGTLGILARRATDRPVPESWAVLFDVKQQAGSFVLIDSVRDQVGAALKFQGRSVNSVDPKDLKAARDLLIAAKKRSVGFDGSVGVKNKVLAKTAQMGIVYSGEGVRAANEDTNLVYVIPKEGSILWVDNLAILAKAPHRDLAEQFLNYILSPEIGAQLSAYTQFSSPNREAKKLMKPADLTNPSVYPAAETMARLELLTDPGQKIRLFDEVWTQVKAK